MSLRLQTRFTFFPRNFVLALGVVLALSGCATMTPEECRYANWYGKGVEDGSQGRAQSFIDNHREACMKVGIMPDYNQWENGRKEGLRYYCTYENGIEVGRRGYGQRNVCPPELQTGFMDGFYAGQRVREAKVRVDRLTNDQRNRRHAYDRAKDDKERRRIREQLRDIEYDLRRARDDLDYEERRLRR